MKHFLPIAAISALLSANIVLADSITFYDQPDVKAKNTQLTTIPANLLSIKDMSNGWLKVADRSTGSVGYMQQKTFQDLTAKNVTDNDGMQVFMATYKNNSNGLPKITIYKNGQRLSDEQAQQVYQKMNENWQKIQQNMVLDNKLMEQNLLAAQQQMQAMLMSLQQVFSPIVISQDNSVETAKPKNDK